MGARVRVDRTSGRNFLDWYLDQGSRWAQTGTYRERENDPTAPIVNVTGYTARLLCRRADADRTLVLDLSSPTDIVIDGPNGTFSWDVDAPSMEALVHVTYDYQLRIFPAGNLDEAYVLVEGRLVMRPMVLA